MHCAIVLYKFFPFGGMQRDCLRIIEALLAAGHRCTIYCMDWEGASPDGAEVRLLRRRGIRNHRRYEYFQLQLQAALIREPVDVVVGFNKMPGLHIYFAADPCFVEKIAHSSSPVARRGGRYRLFRRWEAAVFERSGTTKILLLCEAQRDAYLRHYDTPVKRLHVLPPGVDRSFCEIDDSAQRRKRLRSDIQADVDELVLLFVGSGFITKGLNRVIDGLAALRHEQPSLCVRLLVAGSDKYRQFARRANRLGVGKSIEFLGGREDVQDLMLASDVLVHPAISEAGGVVLLEALACGLPVVTTDVCGYAPHVSAARGGIVLPSPFDQDALNKAIMRNIDGVFRAERRESALRYARLTDLYSLPAKAVKHIEDAVASNTLHD
ncbi:MAG: glycosyltransferase family 4 protein [Pseudomonadota bacterium]